MTNTIKLKTGNGRTYDVSHDGDNITCVYYRGFRVRPGFESYSRVVRAFNTWRAIQSLTSVSHN